MKTLISIAAVVAVAGGAAHASEFSTLCARGDDERLIEIVSPDSGYHDRGRKFELYEAYGVAEYWIVDPDECVVEVYHLQDTTYRRIGVFSRDDRLTARVIADITVDLAAVFPRRSQS